MSGRSGKAFPPPSFSGSYTWPHTLQTMDPEEEMSCSLDGSTKEGTPGSHLSPGLTQRFVSGQHTSPFSQLSAPLQRTPGFVGVRHASASGQQYEPLSAHGVSHALPTFTHSFVRGQQVSSLPQTEASSLQLVFVGVKQCFASGQQYSLLEHPSAPKPARSNFDSVAIKHDINKQAASVEKRAIFNRKYGSAYAIVPLPHLLFSNATERSITNYFSPRGDDRIVVQRWRCRVSRSLLAC